MCYSKILALVAGLAVCGLSEAPVEARTVCSGGVCYNVPDSGYSGGGFVRRQFLRRPLLPPPATRYASYSNYGSSYGSSGGYGTSYGSSGGYGAMSYEMAAPVTYVVSSEPSYSSSTSTVRSTQSAAKAATDADGNVICNCPGCNCGEYVLKLEDRVKALEDSQPFYAPGAAKTAPADKTVKPEIPEWKKASMARGKVFSDTKTLTTLLAWK